MLKKAQFLACTLLATSLVSLPALAQADLTITNKTSHDSASIINGGACSSTFLGDIGVTKAGQKNTISSFMLKIACYGHTTACRADVFMTRDCSGEKAGTVILDVVNGVVSVTNAAGYEISASGFDITLKQHA
jgi:hypothetical protein